MEFATHPRQRHFDDIVAMLEARQLRAVAQDVVDAARNGRKTYDGQPIELVAVTLANQLGGEPARILMDVAARAGAVQISAEEVEACRG